MGLAEPRDGCVHVVEVDLTDCVLAKLFALLVVRLALSYVHLHISFGLVRRKLCTLSRRSCVLLKESYGLHDEVGRALSVVEVDFRLAVLYVFLSFSQVYEVLH